MNTTKMYVINALSNMHVGSGEVNYGVIDNLIQRDAVTGFPGINASGLKGAIRESFKEDTTLVRDIFGSSPKEEAGKTKPGKSRFFEAHLLSLPVRSDKVPFLMATSIEIIKELIYKLKLFNCVENTSICGSLSGFLSNLSGLERDAKKTAIVFNKSLENACVEEVELKATYKEVKDLPPFIEKLFGSPLVVVSHTTFKELCDDNHLPVLARNHLEDGQSENLWYEQVLPRYSRLYFILMEGGANENIKKFNEKIASEIFQLGANASIGYGFCRFVDVSALKN